MKYNRVVVLIAVIVATLALSVGVGTVGAQDLGPEQFNETYGGPDDDRVRSMAQTQDGGYILAGETDSLGGSDAWLIKVDSEGNEQFNKTYGGAGGDVAYSVIET
jgi:hypothetical protein